MELLATLLLFLTVSNVALAIGVTRKVRGLEELEQRQEKNAANLLDRIESLTSTQEGALQTVSRLLNSAYSQERWPD